jgi:hypothetical protein
MNFRADRHSILLLCPLLALLVCVSVYGQGNRGYKGLDAVPLASRARLVERLKLYLKYERKRQYAKLYDLYSPREADWFRNFRQSNPGLISTIETKEIYIKYRKGKLSWARHLPRLLDFIPQRSQEESYGPFAGCYKIYGWARYSKESSESGNAGDILFACFENGDWYFSAGLSTETGGHGEEKPIRVERIEHTGKPELHRVP